MRARLAMLVVALLATGTAAAQAPREVLLLGSSSVNGAVGLEIERRLSTRGIAVRRRARSSSGFARPDYFDWEAQLSQLGPYQPYEAVMVYAGGNDAQALRLMPGERRDDEAGRQWIRWGEEHRWRQLYANRVKAFVNELCTRGARRVIMVLPANGGRPRWRDRIGRVRHAQASGAWASRCGAVLDAGESTFASHDGVHLSRRGAETFWSRLELPLLALLEDRRAHH